MLVSNDNHTDCFIHKEFQLYLYFFLRSLASNQTDKDDEEIVWIKENIVDRYGFEKDKDPKMDAWKNQPDFKEDIGTPEFVTAANRVKSFFEKHNNWTSTKNSPAFRSKDSCLKLLNITAARYLLVTHILYRESGEKVGPCERNKNNKTKIPDSVCYPKPYGGASCTSDYDVGLIGKDAGYVTEKFNNYFQGAEGFEKPSEMVFDTNVYAFTLEYAMPFSFANLPANFSRDVKCIEQTTYYKMQELASAYYKVFKYNEKFFQKMVIGAKMAMKYAKISKAGLNFWLDTFKEMNAETPMKLGGSLKSEEALRTAHNKEYAKYVKGMSKRGEYNPAFLGNYIVFVFISLRSLAI